MAMINPAIKMMINNDKLIKDNNKAYKSPKTDGNNDYSSPKTDGNNDYSSIIPKLNLYLDRIYDYSKKEELTDIILESPIYTERGIIDGLWSSNIVDDDIRLGKKIR